MIEELISRGSEVIEIPCSTFACVIIVALWVGAFCTDATFHFFHWLYKRNKEKSNEGNNKL